MRTATSTIMLKLQWISDDYIETQEKAKDKAWRVKRLCERPELRNDGEGRRELVLRTDERKASTAHLADRCSGIARGHGKGHNDPPARQVNERRELLPQNGIVP